MDDLCCITDGSVILEGGRLCADSKMTPASLGSSKGEPTKLDPIPSIIIQATHTPSQENRDSLENRKKVASIGLGLERSFPVIS